MRRHVPFWGIVLILIGILLLLGNAGVFEGVNVWNLFWPLLLMAFGAWILLGALGGRRPIEVEQASIPLDGATSAYVEVHHGAGRLTVGAGAGPNELAAGEFRGGLEYQAERSGDSLRVNMNISAREWGFWAQPWHWWGPGGALDWNVRFNDDIPLSLKFETGATEMRLDLTDLRVTDLEIKTGASETTLTLPARAGFTRMKLESGAASLKVRVPQGVAARIRAKTGIADVKVDTTRFPRAEGAYQSPDYDTAANKVDMDIETGVASVYIG